MKLKYIVNARIPTEKAHGYQICKMCEEFSGAGVAVELIVPKRRNFIEENAFDFYKVKNNFKITKLFCFDLVKFGYLGFWLQRISFFIAVKFYIWKKHCDILYSREDFLGFFFKDFVLELHSLPDIERKIYKKVINKVSKLIVLNSYLKQDLVEKYGIKEKNILISPDGVDFKKFDLNISKEEVRKKIGLPGDKKIILYTGHLYKWKGADVLAESANFLKEENILFLFVGGTEKDIKTFRKKYNNFRNIKIIGHKPYSEIPFYLRAADLLVLPNSSGQRISCFYTSPLKLFEYMASGRPIVASDLPSIREILNESNAILVKPDKPLELVAGIKKVLVDQNLSASISRQAKLDVVKYSWDNRAKNILHFIQNKI